MKSEHIDRHKLHRLVSENVLLDEPEVQHLSTCEECMELIRVYVRQNQAKRANP